MEREDADFFCGSCSDFRWVDISRLFSSSASVWFLFFQGKRQRPEPPLSFFPSISSHSCAFSSASFFGFDTLPKHTISLSVPCVVTGLWQTPKKTILTFSPALAIDSKRSESFISTLGALQCSSSTPQPPPASPQLQIITRNVIRFLDGCGWWMSPFLCQSHPLTELTRKKEVECHEIFQSHR